MIGSVCNAFLKMPTGIVIILSNAIKARLIVTKRHRVFFPKLSLQRRRGQIACKSETPRSTIGPSGSPFIGLTYFPITSVGSLDHGFEKH